MRWVIQLKPGRGKFTAMNTRSGSNQSLQRTTVGHLGGQRVRGKPTLEDKLAERRRKINMMEQLESGGMGASQTQSGRMLSPRPKSQMSKENAAQSLGSYIFKVPPPPPHHLRPTGIPISAHRRLPYSGNGYAPSGGWIDVPCSLADANVGTWGKQTYATIQGSQRPMSTGKYVNYNQFYNPMSKPATCEVPDMFNTIPCTTQFPPPPPPLPPPPVIRPASVTYPAPTRFVPRSYQSRSLLPDTQRVCQIPATQPRYLLPDAPRVCQIPVAQPGCVMPGSQQVCPLPVSQLQGSLCPDPQPVCKLPVSQPVCQLPEAQPVCRVPVSQQIGQLPVTWLGSQPYFASNQPSLAKFTTGKPSGRPASRDNPDMFNRIAWRSSSPIPRLNKVNWTMSGPSQSLPQFYDVTVPVMVNRQRSIRGSPPDTELQRIFAYRRQLEQQRELEQRQQSQQYFA